MASSIDMMVYEISNDDCKTWEEIEYEKVDYIVRHSYTNGGIMLANLNDGMTVVTPKGKIRARMGGTAYLRRGKGLDRPFHLLDEDGQTSKCGAAHVSHGFQIVYREKVLESMTCTNCLLGRKTR